jgi:hypothetical protein
MLDTTLDLDAAIAAMHEAAEALGRAKGQEMDLDDERVCLERTVILRLMQTTNELTQRPHSASSAKDAVETDAEYQEFRRIQRHAVVVTQTAWSRWEAARARVWAISKGGN